MDCRNWRKIFIRGIQEVIPRGGIRINRHSSIIRMRCRLPIRRRSHISLRRILNYINHRLLSRRTTTHSNSETNRIIPHRRSNSRTRTRIPPLPQTAINPLPLHRPSSPSLLNRHLTSLTTPLRQGRTPEIISLRDTVSRRTEISQLRDTDRRRKEGTTDRERPFYPLFRRCLHRHHPSWAIIWLINFRTIISPIKIRV